MTNQEDALPALPQIPDELLAEIANYAADYARAALAARDRDAERYRYIRDSRPEERNRLEHYASDALDAAIDSAMKP